MSIRNWWWQDSAGRLRYNGPSPLFLLLVVITVLTVVVGTVLVIHNENRYMRDCMADGHKEYECIGIIHHGRQ